MKKINLLNKTISHLSSGYGFFPFHGKGVRLNSRGVWELPRRTPCATPSWKEGERSGRGGLWFAALVALFVATPSFAEPSELDKKTVASKAYVDTKQDIIETGLVEFDDYGTTAAVPALVSTNAAGTALNGNTIGFLDLNTYNNLNRGLDELPDTMVPSIGLLANELDSIWNNMASQWSPLSWIVNNDNGANRIKAINAYNSTFGTGTNNWAGNGNHLINGQFLANSLALKQNKIPAGTVGNVVTYTGTAGTVSSRGVYNDPSSAYFNNPNINDNELITVNAAAAIVDYVDARTPEITCAGVEPGTNECWLWTIPTYTTTTRPLPRGDGNTDVWVTGYTSKGTCINAIRNNTSFTSLSEASNVVNNAPTRVATGLSSTVASNLVSTLVSGGCTAEIRNP